MNLDTPGQQFCVSTQSHVTGRRLITSVSINSQCCAETPAHVCWLQVLLYVSVKSLTFFFFTDLGIGFLKVRSIGTKQLNTASCKYQLYQSLHGCVVIKWFCTTPQFFIDFHPGARSNGVLAPRRTLRPQVLSHCQAALIRSYKSWRDNC